jgi:hypothetical protein
MVWIKVNNATNKKYNNNQLSLKSLTHKHDYDYDVAKQGNGLEET